MSRCEDFPCCGHEPGDCPDDEGRMRCVECGRKLELNARSSICPTCMRHAEARHARGEDMWED